MSKILISSNNLEQLKTVTVCCEDNEVFYCEEEKLQSQFLEDYELLILDIDDFKDESKQKFLKDLCKNSIQIIGVYFDKDKEYLETCLDFGVEYFFDGSLGPRIFCIQAKIILAKSHEDNLRDKLKSFLPQKIFEQIKTNRFKTGEFIPVNNTILFADIRSFTSLSEGLDSNQLYSILNDLYSLMNEAITKNGGYVDKFIGDAVMGIFENEEGAVNATRAGIEMQTLIQKYNLIEKPSEVPSIDIGIGINTGEVTLGTLGGHDRCTHTVIGDAVNVASRLEFLTKRFKAKILISEYVYECIQEENFHIREIDTMRVRGSSKPVSLYEIYENDSEYVKQRKDQTKENLLKGIHFYKDQNFREALEYFKKCFELYQSDGLIFDYIKRCHYYSRYASTQENWDGVVSDDLLINWEYRRRFPRHNTEIKTVVSSGIKLPNQQKMVGRIKDVSNSGIKMELNAFVRPGDCVLTELLTNSSEKNSKLSLSCKVCWVNEHPSKDEGFSVIAGLDVFTMNFEDEKKYKKFVLEVSPQTSLENLYGKILVLDRDEKYCQKIKAELNKSGYEVFYLLSDEDLMETLNNEKFELFLLELGAEEGAKKSILKKLRSLDTHKDLPIIIMGEGLSDAMFLKGYKAGANDVISKTASIEMLSARISSQISIYRILENSSMKIKEMNLKLQEMFLKSETASRSKSEFLSNINHELRTPLNGIIGSCSILKEGLPPESLQILKLIERSGYKLLEVIDSILDYARIDGDEDKINFAEILLQNEIDDLDKKILFKLGKSGVKYNCNVALPEGLIIKSDKDKIRQITENLLSNAFKFTEKGTVDFNITSREQSDGKIKIRFEIIDTGIGFNSNDARHFFEPFYQKDQSYTRNYQGIGLGLSICKKYAKSLNSVIEFESKPNLGSRFWFEIEAEVIAQKKVFDVSEGETIFEVIKDATEDKTYKILIVDDDHDNCFIAEMIIKSLGLESETAYNGKEALEKYQKSNQGFSLILMDVHMPIMDGLEATRRIREYEKANRCFTPIVSLTALSTIEDENACLNSGMNEYLAKPISKKKLSEVINKWVIS